MSSTRSSEVGLEVVPEVGFHGDPLGLHAQLIHDYPADPFECIHEETLLRVSVPATVRACILVALVAGSNACQCPVAGPIIPQFYR